MSRPSSVWGSGPGRPSSTFGADESPPTQPSTESPDPATLTAPVSTCQAGGDDGPPGGGGDPPVGVSVGIIDSFSYMAALVTDTYSQDMLSDNSQHYGRLVGPPVGLYADDPTLPPNNRNGEHRAYRRVSTPDAGLGGRAFDLSALGVLDEVCMVQTVHLRGRTFDSPFAIASFWHAASRPPAFPNATLIESDLRVQITPDYRMQLRVKGGATYTSASPISTTEFVKIVFRLKAHPTHGSFKCATIDLAGTSTVVINQPDIVTTVGGAIFAYPLAWGGLVGFPTDQDTTTDGILQHDFILRGRLGLGTGELPGDLRAGTIQPRADGSFSQGAGHGSNFLFPPPVGNWQHVILGSGASGQGYGYTGSPIQAGDESNTSVGFDTSGQKDSYLLDPVAADAAAIQSVEVQYYGSRSGSADLPNVIRLFVISGGVTAYSPPINLTHVSGRTGPGIGGSISITNQTALPRWILEHDPHTGAAWTVAAVNALQAGVEATTVQPATTTNLGLLNVEYVYTTGPVVPPPASFTLPAAQGSYALTGRAATLFPRGHLVADTGTYALTGQAAALSGHATHITMAAAQGSYSLTGQAAGLTSVRWLPGMARFDDWSADTTEDPDGGAERSYLLANVDPSRWPRFANPVGPVLNESSQAIMDQDIQLAYNAGMRFWMFQSFCSAGRYAADQYFASPNKHLLKVTKMEQSLSTCRKAMTIGWMADAQFLRYNTRPVVFLYLPALRSSGNTNTDVIAYRAQIVAAGFPNPYFVALENDKPTLAASLGTWDVDAGGWYVGGQAGLPAGTSAYATQASAEEAEWEALRGTGRAMIPTVTAGWDARHFGGTPVVDYATPAELAAHAQVAVDFVVAHPASVPTHIILFSAWNEITERHAFCPTYVSGNPAGDTSRLDAIAGVLNA